MLNAIVFVMIEWNILFIQLIPECLIENGLSEFKAGFGGSCFRKCHPDKIEGNLIGLFDVKSILNQWSTGSGRDRERIWLLDLCQFEILPPACLKYREFIKFRHFPVQVVIILRDRYHAVTGPITSLFWPV